MHTACAIGSRETSRARQRKFNHVRTQVGAVRVTPGGVGHVSVVTQESHDSYDIPCMPTLYAHMYVDVCLKVNVYYFTQG